MDTKHKTERDCESPAKGSSSDAAPVIDLLVGIADIAIGYCLRLRTPNKKWFISWASSTIR